ncbi:hypothetical protein K2Q08_02175 [Patescibacteria group bacterium]|nr:hypothetical protein [Patescibacteria group bacterium]
MEIVPAILPTSSRDLESHLLRVRGITRSVQIDVCDGFFVPSKTFPYTEKDFFAQILAEEETLPFWEDFDFELDLMVNESKNASADWVTAGASRIIVHIESPDDKLALVALQPLRDTYATAVDVAVAINLDTPIERLEPLSDLVSTIQCMGIVKIGIQGQPLDDRIYDRVAEVRRLYPEHVISVDGGVRIENAKALKEAGATRLVVGSALFEGSVEDNYEALLSELS